MKIMVKSWFLIRHHKKFTETYLELTLGEEARGSAERKAWPPTRPPDGAAEAWSPTDPSVKTPAANVTIASFANSFSTLLTHKKDIQ